MKDDIVKIKHFEKKSDKKNGFLFFLKEKLLYIFIGFLLCNILFFILCGGKNYIRLYYELKEFINVYDIISNEYYGELNKGEMLSSAIDSLLNGVDDNFTTYIDKNNANSFLENVNGTYEGIGCTVSTTTDEGIVIVEVFDDSPAKNSGVLAGDIILKINGIDYSGKTSEDMSNYVKNDAGDEIKLTVKRNDEILEKSLKRKKIEVPVASGKIIDSNDKKIGYIRLELFSDIAYKQFKKKLTMLEKEKIKGLIVDVRNNSGGYLSSVTDISSLFLKKGKIIYKLENNNKIEKIKDTTLEKRNYPIVVLVNDGSASASEIFAGAIKESYGGYILGTNTYGKGTVQKTKMLDDGSMIKYTVQEWLTPNGNSVNKVGIKPTNIVEYDYNLEYDNQLEEALKLISIN